MNRRKPILANETFRAVCALLTFGGCAGLQSALDASGELAAPEVELGRVQLVEVPSQAMLQAYLCPRVLEPQLRSAAVAGLACRPLFGDAPARDQMKFAFDLHLRVDNPNRAALPLSALLTTVRVFPGTEQSELGASCVRLCAADDGACLDAEEDPCRADATDVTQAGDVQRALGALIVAEGVRLGSGDALEVSRPNVLAERSLALVARFALDPERVVPVLERLARQSLDEFQRGEPVSFAISYALEGTLFSDGGGFGRLAAPYGPLAGTFEVPVERGPRSVAAR